MEVKISLRCRQGKSLLNMRIIMNNRIPTRDHGLSFGAGGLDDFENAANPIKRFSR
jgi:hypothetical protein